MLEDFFFNYIPVLACALPQILLCCLIVVGVGVGFLGRMSEEAGMYIICLYSQQGQPRYEAHPSCPVKGRRSIYRAEAIQKMLGADDHFSDNGKSNHPYPGRNQQYTKNRQVVD